MEKFKQSIIKEFGYELGNSNELYFFTCNYCCRGSCEEYLIPMVNFSFEMENKSFEKELKDYVEYKSKEEVRQAISSLNYCNRRIKETKKENSKNNTFS